MIADRIWRVSLPVGKNLTDHISENMRFPAKQKIFILVQRIGAQVLSQFLMRNCRSENVYFTASNSKFLICNETISMSCLVYIEQFAFNLIKTIIEMGSQIFPISRNGNLFPFVFSFNSITIS